MIYIGVHKPLWTEGIKASNAKVQLTKKMSNNGIGVMRSCPEIIYVFLFEGRFGSSEVQQASRIAACYLTRTER